MQPATSLPTCIRVISALAASVVLAAPALAQKLVLGGKNFTEQQILAEITTRYLTANGFAIDKRVGLGSVALRQAQESGQIDLCWEYTGTALIIYNKVTEKLDAPAVYQKVKELDAAKGLVWLQPSRANNTYAIAMRRHDAQAKNIRSISDLAAHINSANRDQALKFGSNAEFYARSDGLRPLQELYGFEFGRANVIRMDGGLIATALRDGQVDVGVVTATDGRVQAFDFVTLSDDKAFFPDYALTPVVRAATLAKHPGLAALLNKLSAQLDDTVMRRLNASVDLDRKSIESVAAEFLATSLP